MKRLTFIALTMALLSTMPVFADEGMDVDKKVEKMKTELGLDAEQEASVKTILNEYKSKMEAIKQEKKDKLDAVLTPEQKTKHEAMMKEWKEKRKEEKEHKEAA